jgi:hypothetical protein
VRPAARISPSMRAVIPDRSSELDDGPCDLTTRSQHAHLARIPAAPNQSSRAPACRPAGFTGHPVAGGLRRPPAIRNRPCECGHH